MITQCFGLQMYTTKGAKILYLTSNFLLNILILIIFSLHADSTTELLGNYFKIIILINQLETITLLCTILLIVEKNESIAYFAIVRTTVIILIFDLILTFKALVYISLNMNTNKDWNIEMNNEESESPQDQKFYPPIIMALPLYFVFKMCVTFGVFRLGMKSRNENVDGSIVVYYIRNNEHAERNASLGTPLSSAPPPSYDQCVIESSAPPPSYDDIQK